MSLTGSYPDLPQHRRDPEYLGGISRWLQIVAFFTIADFGARFKRSSISALITMLEPVALISVIFVARWFSSGVLDWNDAVFHATGILPFYLFMHISQRLRGLELLPEVPNVSWTERAIALAFAEMIGKTIVAVLLLSFLYYEGAHKAIPYDTLGLIVPCILLSITGFGVGLFNSGLAVYLPSWLYLYAIGMRIIMLASGLVVRADMVPATARTVTFDNPVFQGITWFRSAFYYGYPTFMLDKTYFIECTIAALFVGGFARAVTKPKR